MSVKLAWHKCLRPPPQHPLTYPPRMLTCNGLSNKVAPLQVPSMHAMARAVQPELQLPSHRRSLTLKSPDTPPPRYARQFANCEILIHRQCISNRAETEERHTPSPRDQNAYLSSGSGEKPAT